VTTLVVDGIGLLVTCDPTLGEGPLGLVRGAAVVLEDDHIVAVSRVGHPDADVRLDVGGRCVLPGFVDSHTHLVFAGDRADEFAARMAGRPYQTGGIRVTTAATRAASDDELRRLLLLRRPLRAGPAGVEPDRGPLRAARGGPDRRRARAW
jgi:imidazolonepropionase